METLIITQSQLNNVGNKSFIEANTVPLLFSEIEKNHIIPVFTKDNEPLISQRDFIHIAEEVASNVFRDEVIVPANIRVSHPVKGRIPDARTKPANQLEEWEKTVYYERMMFLVEIPSIRETVDGNVLNLTIGGVKSYGQDNLSGRKGSDEHFKIFVGFKNQVCTNLCVWTDGLQSNVKVKSSMQLMMEFQKLLTDFKLEQQLSLLRRFPDYSITEHQFATLIGRCKLYQYLPSSLKKEIPLLTFGDAQISTVARDYYEDESFSRQGDGSINLWKVYNLFTGANKSSYIDGFLPRSVNASTFVRNLADNLETGTSWFLH
ncbi:DUF3871 family protein [Dyadobacter chenhuakuii]|uniref:DUF3871 family protein n=1 Tax=Dyadobacter chenhuakuii TaxID=2909339 RepID=A0A9X1QJZ3_9BACT|nr:DUF3871 family protein [Dyadobacter chenhuakuii]MCF2501692.1 DUF3871 family protein [Dyadobacter chenhuakuii]